MAKIARIKSAHFQPDYSFLESHVWHAPPNYRHCKHLWIWLWHWHPISAGLELYLRLEAVGLVEWQWTHTKPTLVICWFSDWFLNREYGIWRRVSNGRALMGKRSVHFLIRWLPDLSINRNLDALSTDTNRLWRVQVVSTSIPRHQYSPINKSINWSFIYQRKYKTDDISLHLSFTSVDR